MFLLMGKYTCICIWPLSNHLMVGVFWAWQRNKQILIDAVVHAVNEDYVEMAGDFTRLGFLAPGTDVTPIVPALEAIWENSTGKGLADFNFRTVTSGYSKLQYANLSFHCLLACLYSAR